MSTSAEKSSIESETVYTSRLAGPRPAQRSDTPRSITDWLEMASIAAARASAAESRCGSAGFACRRRGRCGGLSRVGVTVGCGLSGVGSVLVFRTAASVAVFVAAGIVTDTASDGWDPFPAPGWYSYAPISQPDPTGRAPALVDRRTGWQAGVDGGRSRQELVGERAAAVVLKRSEAGADAGHVAQGSEVARRIVVQIGPARDDVGGEHSKAVRPELSATMLLSMRILEMQARPPALTAVFPATVTNQLRSPDAVIPPPLYPA